MKQIKYILILILALSFNNSFSQDFMRKIKNTTWIFGLSGHIVVDGGKELSFPFNTKAWNYVPYPSRITVDGYITKGWSLQAEFAYTQYKAGNVQDGITLSKAATYFGADLNARFAFNHFAKKQGWFDPYGVIGYGYTYRSLAENKSTGNNNLGLGCNFWVYKGFGVNLQGVGKFVMKGGTKSNYTQYSFGIVYKLVGQKRTTANK